MNNFDADFLHSETGGHHHRISFFEVVFCNLLTQRSEFFKPGVKVNRIIEQIFKVMGTFEFPAFAYQKPFEIFFSRLLKMKGGPLRVIVCV